MKKLLLAALLMFSANGFAGVLINGSIETIGTAASDYHPVWDGVDWMYVIPGSGSPQPSSCTHSGKIRITISTLGQRGFSILLAAKATNTQVKLHVEEGAPDTPYANYCKLLYVEY